MIEQTVKIGLVGFGTIGCGVAKLLIENRRAIAEKMGLQLELACVVDIDTKRPRPVKLPAGLLTDDINKLLSDRSIEIAIELVGGTTAARDIILKMLAAGKDVVTANKAVLAEFGSELYAAAAAAGRCIAFEGSCAAGIPIISAIRTGLAANRIGAIYGILNGTCNYILSRMTSEDSDFSQALAEARYHGYAEADPTLDINGTDSAHKLAILASIAFGYEIKLQDIFIEGIQDIRIEDCRYGGEMGYVVKLLAIGRKDEQDKVSLRVHPSFVVRNNALARVDGPFNAISIFGDFVGQTIYYGRGAGMNPTASAVVADIIDVALGNSTNTFRHLRIKPRNEIEGLIDTIDNLVSRFYIRVMAKDRPGVVAAYSKVLGDHQISISGALQHEGAGPDNTVPVVITTHPTRQKNITAALRQLRKLDVLSGEPVCIRIVDIPEDRD
jgi:homoserine dehydrogenase